MNFKYRMHGLVVLLIVLFCSTLSSAKTEPTDWPAWRKDGTGHYEPKSQLPEQTAISSTLWQSEIAGFGYSSPIVVGSHVFVTASIREDFKQGPWVVGLAILSGIAAYLVWWVALLGSNEQRHKTGHLIFGAYVIAFALSELAQRTPNVSSTFLSGSYSVRMWLVSHFVAGTAVMMGLFYASRTTTARMIASLAVVALVVWFALMPPDRNYQDSRFGHRWIYWLSCCGGIGFGFAKTNFGLRWPIVPFLIGAVASAFCIYFVVFTEHHVPSGFWVVGGWIAMTMIAGAIFTWSSKTTSDLSGSCAPLTSATLSISSAVLIVWSGNYAPSIAGTRLELVCINVDNGNELWRSGFVSTSLSSPHYANSYATPTPASDGDRVFTYFGAAGLAAFDARNGSLLWRHENLPMKSAYGAGTSPILFDDMVILATDDDSESFVSAYEVATGQLRWRSNRSSNRGSFGTPCKANISGEPAVVVGGGGLLAAYVPKTGQVIWSQKLPFTEVVASPVVDGEMLYFASENTMLAYKLSTSGAKLEWEMFDDAPWVASPLIWKDKIITLSDEGVVSILDKLSGRLINRIDLDCGTCFASPVVCGNTLLCCSKGGRVISIRVPDLAMLNQTELGQTCVASPAVTLGGTIIRTVGQLTMFAPQNR